MTDTCLSSNSIKGFKRSGIKAFTEAKVTPVILVCVYNQNSTVITHDILYNVFAPYGKVLRILLFEKMKVWKAFLEFDNLDSAFEAKRDLNDFLLFNDGTRMNVYYSNLDTIKFQNNNSGGKDYTLEDYDPNEFNGEQDIDMNMEAYYGDQDPEGLDHNLNPEMYEECYQDEGLMGVPQGYQYQQETQIHTKKDNAVFDDKDDDILKIINDHEKNLNTKAKSKEPQSICEEDKFDADKDDDIFSQYFTTPFQTKLPQPSTKPNRFKQRTLSTKSQAFGVQIPTQPIWQQPNHEQQLNNGDSTPPGLMQYGDSSPLTTFPAQRNHKMIGFSNSMTQIPRALPFTPNRVTSNFANSTENSPLRPGLIPKNLPHFHSMNSIPTSYGPPFHQILNSQPEEIGKMRQYPAIPKGNFRSSFDPRNVNQLEAHMSEDIDGDTSPKINNLSYESLVEMIEQDITQNWSSLIKSANLSSLHASLFQDDTLGGLSQDRIGNLSNMSVSALSQLYNELSVLLGKADNNKKSPVLYVQGFENSEIQMSMIYNIFSNFGNIVKIIFIKDKGSALIEFENAESSAIAKDNLNDIVFMGNALRIYYSNYSIINMRAKKTGGQDSNEEIFLGNAKTFRFKKNKNILINPPAPTLHISNLTKEVCQSQELRDYFSPYGKIQAMKFMFVENKNMCLMKMASVEESLIAMAYLHDTELGGRKVQISFTRSKF